MMKKILIVEDDSSISLLQKDYLELAGYEVEICSDGEKGVKAIEENNYDLLILDIMLPKISGLDILRRIKDTKEIPVLLVTAKKEEIDKIKGLSLGADDYITKPFSPGELVARVKSHIENYDRLKSRFCAVAPINSLMIRGLEIQKDSRQVTMHGKELNLTQKEFELLLYMAENPNRAFTRDQLFERIWGLDSLGDSATVTVHIARVREKIESSPSNPQYIETVWGVGYRFKV